jgi:TrmH family RNA methyltransferase
LSFPALTSRRHDVVQRLRALATRRRRGDPVLLDGEHLLAEALDAGIVPELVVFDGTAQALCRRAQAAGAAVYLGSRAVLEAVSPVRTPAGVVAAAAWTPAPVARVLDARPGPAIGLLDVQDPGNVGGIIRSAHALGGGGVIAIGASADPGGWKAVRGSMGSLFRLPVARAELDDVLEAARARRVAVAATLPEGGEPLETADFERRMLVLFGSEGSGLPADLVARCDLRLTVPLSGHAESLNVGAAAALVLWEARRRRTGAAPASS